MRIAVLGTGNMGSAILHGMSRTYGAKSDLYAWDVKPKARGSVPPHVKLSAPETWLNSRRPPDVVILAVKPAEMERAIAGLSKAAPHLNKPLWCSIAAGVGLSTLSRYLGPEARIARIMPNTPALIGEAMTAFSVNGRCAPSDSEKVKYVFSTCGRVVQVDEKLMNAVTGLSGSGPAYVYLFIEALIEGGVAAGLPFDIARECAVQTVIGAARMVERSAEAPSALKSKVMSPSGTTVQGVLALEKLGVKYGVMQAVLAAARRAEELGR